MVLKNKNHWLLAVSFSGSSSDSVVRAEAMEMQPWTLKLINLTGLYLSGRSCVSPSTCLCSHLSLCELSIKLKSWKCHEASAEDFKIVRDRKQRGILFIAWIKKKKKVITICFSLNALMKTKKETTLQAWCKLPLHCPLSRGSFPKLSSLSIL